MGNLPFGRFLFAVLMTHIWNDGKEKNRQGSRILFLLFSGWFFFFVLLADLSCDSMIFVSAIIGALIWYDKNFNLLFCKV